LIIKSHKAVDITATGQYIKTHDLTELY